MAIAAHLRHFSVAQHPRLWLIAGALIAFLLVALWSQPVH